MTVQSKRKKIFYLIFAVVFAISSVATVRADTASDLQQQKAQLDVEQKQYQATINQLGKSSSTLKNQIALYNAQIASTEVSLQQNSNDIATTQLQITQTQAKISDLQIQIANNKNLLAGLMTELYELNDNSVVLLNLSSANFSDFLDQLAYTSNIQKNVYDLLQNIKTVSANLQAQQDQLTANYNQLNQQQDSLTSAQSALQSQRGAKQSLLTQTNGKESQYQKLLSADQKKEAAIDSEISRLSQSAQSSGGSGIPATKGVLEWPVNGIVSQGYGNTGFTALGYNFHNGLDIAGPAGTPVHAAADGTVLQCESDATAYGNWCTIKHNISTSNGTKQIITLYGHMRSYIVSAGQTLKQDAVIGYEGNTGNTTRLIYGPERGYHVHFSVFDVKGYTVVPGANTKLYGKYAIPNGYTYNPLEFLGSQ